MRDVPFYLGSGGGVETLGRVGAGGGSDPYMVATTDPPALLSVRNQNHIVKTKYLVNDINPNWGGVKLHIPIVSCDVEGLRLPYFTLISGLEYFTKFTLIINRITSTL